MSDDEWLREFKVKHGIFDHPELGFCKLGEYSIDAAQSKMSISIIPVQIVFDLVLHENGEVEVKTPAQ